MRFQQPPLPLRHPRTFDPFRRVAVDQLSRSAESRIAWRIARSRLTIDGPSLWAATQWVAGARPASLFLPRPGDRDTEAAHGGLQRETRDLAGASVEIGWPDERAASSRPLTSRCVRPATPVIRTRSPTRGIPPRCPTVIQLNRRQPPNLRPVYDSDQTIWGHEQFTRSREFGALLFMRLRCEPPRSLPQATRRHRRDDRRRSLPFEAFLGGAGRPGLLRYDLFLPTETNWRPSTFACRSRPFPCV